MRKFLLLSSLLLGTFSLFPAATAFAADTPGHDKSASYKMEPQRHGRTRTYNVTETNRNRRGGLVRKTFRVTERNGVVISKVLISKTRIR
jgi:hypothetical protein